MANHIFQIPTGKKREGHGSQIMAKKADLRALLLTFHSKTYDLLKPFQVKIRA